MRYHSNLYDFCQNMALFILYRETLQLLTFRVNSGVRFAFSAMRKEAQNLVRMRSCRFLKTKRWIPENVLRYVE